MAANSIPKKPDPRKTRQLFKRRKERTNLNQAQVAAYFGYKRADTVSAWENGASTPPETLRARFIDYLWEVLRLREEPEEFVRIWQEIMEQEWGWPPLREGEYPPDFPPGAFPWRKEPLLQPEQPPPHFVVRKKHVETLEKALSAEEHHGPITMVGPPGAGKTALAAHIARELKEEFPGGVLWCHLDAEDPMSILTGIALRYGRHDVREFENVPSRSQLVRGILANKRALLVLDAAPGINEIEPLLPPPGSCAVIITSQNRTIFGLTRTPRQMEVGPFERKEGTPETDEVLQLAVKILGEKRVQEERTALSELAAELEYLPFALDIALSTVARWPHWSISTFLNELNSVNQRLDLLEEVRGRSVRAAFEVAYEALERPDQKQFFAKLGVFGASDFSDEAAAYVTELPADEARLNLNSLYDVSLVQVNEAGRYRLHALLSDYAREKISFADPYKRMVDYFVDYIESHERDYEALAAEQDTILAALNEAHSRQMETELVRGANLLYRFLSARGFYTRAKTHLQRARLAAERLGDTEGLATSLLNLGRVEVERSEYKQAEEHLREALALAQDHAQSIMNNILAALGVTQAHRGSFDGAIEFYKQGAALARETGDKEGLCDLLKFWGAAADHLGNYRKAKECYDEALALAVEIGDLSRQSDLHLSMGALAADQGNFELAKQELQQGLEQAQKIGHEERISHFLQNLAGVAISQAHYEKAEAYSEEGVRIAREISHLERLSLHLVNLGALKFFREDYVGAEEAWREGLEVAQETGHVQGQVYMLTNLAEIARVRENYRQADEYLQDALVLARESEQRSLLSGVLTTLGELRLQQKDVPRARRTFEEALEVAEAEDPQERIPERIGDAKFGLCKTEELDGNYEKAERYGEESLAIFQAHKHRKTAEVKDRLAKLRSLKNEK